MAIFGKKKNTAAKTDTESVAVVAPVSKVVAANTMSALLSPRITEKGTILAEQGAYVFNVDKRANKREIAHAVSTIFKVTPRKVRVVHMPAKTVRSRTTNRIGKSASGKKAYVYLKKGDKIETS